MPIWSRIDNTEIRGDNVTKQAMIKSLVFILEGIRFVFCKGRQQKEQEEATEGSTEWVAGFG